MIEYFVHIDPSDPPKDLALVTIEVSDEISRLAISPKQLRPDWRVTPAPSELASFGDNFVKEGRAAILTVPSALAPAESNWLINPQHPDFGKLRVHPVEEFEYDVRFFK
jgi:RES domain-containing protein